MNRCNDRLGHDWPEPGTSLAIANTPPCVKVIAQFSSLRIELSPGASIANATRIARTAANAVRAIGHRFIEADVVNNEGEIFIIISHLNPRMSRAKAVEVAERAIRRIEVAN